MICYQIVSLFEARDLLETFQKRNLNKINKNIDYSFTSNYQNIKKNIKNYDLNNEKVGYACYVLRIDIPKHLEKRMIDFNYDCENEVGYIDTPQKFMDFYFHIVSTIKIEKAYFGEKYIGINPSAVSGFKEKNPLKQIELLKNIKRFNEFDFSGTVFVEWVLINLNYFFWKNDIENKNILADIIFCLKRNEKCFLIDEF